MANLDIDFGTFDLNSTNNVSVAAIKIKVMKALKASVLPKGQGSIIPIASRSSIGVNLSGKIKGATYTTLRDNIQALKAAFEQSSEQKFTLDDERFIRAQYRNFTNTMIFLSGVAAWAVQLIASDPFWYSETLNSNSDLTTAAPSKELTNAGDAETRCKITVTAGANAIVDDLKIENTTLGITLQFRGTIAATKSLVINNRVDQNTGFIVLNDGVNAIVDQEGDKSSMAAGANTWTLTTLTADVTVKIEHRDAWV